MTHITPESKVRLTVAAFLGCASLLVGATWRVAMYLSAIDGRLESIQREMAISVRERWTVMDQERWAFALERQNRERGLVVPEVNRPKETASN